MKNYLRPLLTLCLVAAIGTANATWKPFCSAGQSTKKQLIIAYLGTDSSWGIKNGDLGKLEEQLSQISLVNYAFIRLAKDDAGNTVLKPSPQDIENIQLLRQIKPNLPIIIAVGGWGEREGFKPFLENEEQMNVFVHSVKETLQQYQLDGIDLDWENELLASVQETAGVAKLLQRLHENLNSEGYCVTNAVPATKAYWTQYPDAGLWQAYVNWTTIMAYDHYGTFGPRTELAAALYESNRQEDKTYPYPSTSGDEAVQYYFHQGLVPEKIILGIPFYCHSYYLKSSMIANNNENPGLHVSVVDPNISSQVSYNDAYTAYGDKLFTYKANFVEGDRSAMSFYGLIPIENTTISRFMNCEGPRTILDKIIYVEGKNPMSEQLQKQVKLGGVSFWSLQQDLPFSDRNSLLLAIHQG